MASEADSILDAEYNENDEDFILNANEDQEDSENDEINNSIDESDEFIDNDDI